VAIQTAGACHDQTRRISDIVVGSRHRRDLGDIDALARNIRDVGLLHPIVVRPDGTLIAGERRLKAFKLNGQIEIPVTILDLEAVVRGEYAENALRKDFTLSEAVAIKRDLEPLEKAAAKERQAASGERPAVRSTSDRRENPCSGLARRRAMPVALAALSAAR
jgi:ParB family chromosome partitioning protein